MSAKQNEKGISGRDFVKGATVGAGVGTLAALMPGATSRADAQVEWDAEADVIAIGAGIAGCIAAAEARDAGAGNVIILEKMKGVFEAPKGYGYTGRKGNDTAKSGGGWGALFPFPFPKTATVDDVVKAGVEESKGRAYPDLCNVFWRRLNDDFFWIKDQAKLPLKDRSTYLRPGSYSTVGTGL